MEEEKKAPSKQLLKFYEIKKVQKPIGWFKKSSYSDQNLPKLLAFGRTGQGKSTLLNLLIGQQNFFTVGDGANAGTTATRTVRKRIMINNQAKYFYIADTVGIGDLRLEDNQRMRQLRAKIRQQLSLNVILIVTKNSRVDDITIKMIQELIQLFGQRDWLLKHCIIIKSGSFFGRRQLREKPLDVLRQEINVATSLALTRQRENNVFKVFFVDSQILDAQYYQDLHDQAKDLNNMEIQSLKNEIKRISQMDPVYLTLNIIQRIQNFFQSEILDDSNQEQKTLLALIHREVQNAQIRNSTRTWHYSKAKYIDELRLQVQDQIVQKTKQHIQMLVQEQISRLAIANYEFFKFDIPFNLFICNLLENLHINFDPKMDLQSLIKMIVSGAVAVIPVFALGVGVTYFAYKFYERVNWNKQEATLEFQKLIWNQNKKFKEDIQRQVDDHFSHLVPQLMRQTSQMRQN